MNITGGALEFVNSSGALAPVVNLASNKGGGTGPAMTYNVANNLVLTNDTTFSGNGTATFNLNGAISGAGKFTKSGTSTLTLAGTNSYTGGTSITAGTLRINSAGALGTPTVTPDIAIASAGALATNGFAVDQALVNRVTAASAGSIVTGVGHQR